MIFMSSKIFVKNHVNNSMSESLHRFGYYYDSLETDIFVDANIEKDKEVKLILNNKMFDFISEINIQFYNDFDNKIFFDNIPKELNELIETNLIDEKSINIDLYNIDKICDFNFETKNIHKNLNQCKILFKLKNNFLKNVLHIDELKNYIYKIPSFLIKNSNEYGILIKSNIKRKLKIIITYMNFNIESFYNFKDKMDSTTLI